MRPEEFQRRFDVSRETLERLTAYHALLLKWQKAINLVSPSTLPHAWERHFADSAQLSSCVPEGVQTLADLGSGAGFPGMVLAILRPDVEVHLIESDERKAQFLRTVSRETDTGVRVHNKRIEHAVQDVSPDIVTARALASLDLLLGLCLPWSLENPELSLLFLKGRGAQEEIEKAHTKFCFDVDAHESLTDDKARILSISALSRLKNT